MFGANAKNARLRDMSGFEDPHLVRLLEQLREETGRTNASRMFVRGVAQALAIHLARNYTAITEAARGEMSSLPGFKLRRVTDWMAAHLNEEFSLPRLAEQAGMSEFHFNRLFKRATGVPPSQYQIKLRIDAARRLLRETKNSVITIANEVGYSNPAISLSSSEKRPDLLPPIIGESVDPADSPRQCQIDSAYSDLNAIVGLTLDVRLAGNQQAKRATEARNSADPTTTHGGLSGRTGIILPEERCKRKGRQQGQ